MSKNVFFDYQLSYQTIVVEKNIFDFSILDETELNRIARGKLVVFFEKKRNYIIIEDSILSYINQIKFALTDIESGHFNISTVSRYDWYSNNIQFTYNEESKKLRLYDINDQEFTIQIDYSKFRNAFNNFSKSFVEQIVDLYPGLQDNPTFLKMENEGYFYFR